MRRLERLTGRKIERLHIVGGGSKDMMLNQCAANALNIPVIVGPAECTALGNILVQAIALGHLPSLAAAREVVRNSFELKTVTPPDAAQGDAAAARFEKLLSRSGPNQISAQRRHYNGYGLPKRSAEHRPGKFEWEITFEPGRHPAFQMIPLQLIC